MQTLYVVVGETGEYGDSREWFVAAYTDKERAEDHAKRATAAMERSKPHTLLYMERARFKETFPYDNDCQIDQLTRTTYSVAEIPLVAHVDEYIETFTRA